MKANVRGCVMSKCKEYNTFALVRFEKHNESSTFCYPRVLSWFLRCENVKKKCNTFALVCFDKSNEYNTLAAHASYGSCDVEMQRVQHFRPGAK